jgi:hypothetical protein
LALLLNEYGFDRGAKLAAQLARAASQASGADPKPLFATISSFSRLEEIEKNEMLALLLDSLQKFAVAFAPLTELVPEHPLSFLCKAHSGQGEQNFSRLLGELYDRGTRLAVQCMAVATYLALDQDKLRMPTALLDKTISDLESVRDYPETDASRSAASSFRAGAPMLLLGPSLEEEEPEAIWLDLFWTKAVGLGPCVVRNPIEVSEQIPEDPLGRLVFTYRQSAKTELVERLQQWGFDLNDVEKHEVIGGLLARQTTLAIEIAIAPTTWNPRVAPILLRSMADVHIALVWILLDPSKRAIKFIDDGLGAVKLEIAHRKKQLEIENDSEAAETQRKMIEYWEAWLQSQRLDQLIDINLGSWSGINTRKMAEEAGVIDFYNYVYQPFSGAVHSNWAHVGDKNTNFCENPAHRYHKVIG